MLISFAGSFILNQPAEGCINDLIDMNLFSKLPVKSNNPKFLLAASHLHSIENGSFSYQDVIDDYSTLFGDIGLALAPPFASVYLSRDHLIIDKHTLEVRKIYNSYGWKSRNEGIIPDDHLGIELQFINLLLEKYIELDDGVCKKELTGDLKRFIELHLQTWIEDWGSKIQSNSSTDFYKGIGYLAVSCIEDVYSLL